MIGKKTCNIIYIANSIMQQCKSCSSNPKNKIFKYQTFESIENLTNDTSKPKKVVEGLTAEEVDENRDLLEIKMKELNNMHVTGPQSRYATQKQNNDKVMYTNILLTALATSILYYLIVDI
jgi:hypothetical protein